MTSTSTTGSTATDPRSADGSTSGSGGDPTDARGLSTVPAEPGSGGPGDLIRAWRRLTSMRTALLLLFVLAIAAIPGSLFPQRGGSPVRVEQYLAAHTTAGPVLDRLGMFDVFASPWFAAIYLLLFVSLVGCVTPRIRMHAASLRSVPPATPRHLDRVRAHAIVRTDADPATVHAEAARLLRGGLPLVQRWQVRRIESDRAGLPSIAAERGRTRETGNLVFHVSLVALLVALALGGLLGYQGTVIVVQGGKPFANSQVNYDTLRPGRLVDDSSMAPFTVALDKMVAKFRDNGQPEVFRATLGLTSGEGTSRTVSVRPNHPATVDDTRVYLSGNGYAPQVTVRDATGAVAFSGAVPFLPSDATYVSNGVIKVPDTTPAKDGIANQLGFSGVLLPTAVQNNGGILRSVSPNLDNPTLTVVAYRGNLGLDGTAQSVYSLDTKGMQPVATGLTNADGSAAGPFQVLRASQRVMQPGDRWDIPGGGSITFDGVAPWANLTVNKDPGKPLALLSAVLIVVGLLLSLRVRRRRVWVRAVAADRSLTGSDENVRARGSTVVTLAGLARSDSDDVAEALDRLAERLARRTGGTVERTAVTEPLEPDPRTAPAPTDPQTEGEHP